MPPEQTRSTAVCHFTFFSPRLSACLRVGLSVCLSVSTNILITKFLPKSWLSSDSGPDAFPLGDPPFIGGMARWVTRASVALLYMFWCRLRRLRRLHRLHRGCRLITFAPMDKRHLMTQSCQQWEAPMAERKKTFALYFTHIPFFLRLLFLTCNLAKCKWVVRATCPRTHF